MSFNTVGFTIFGIPPYFFCAVIGLVVAVSLNIILVSSKKYALPKHMRNLIVALLSMVVFAKLFGCLSGIYRAIGENEPITFETIKNTGIVFYGGLLGLLLSYYIGTRTKLISPDERKSIDVLAVSIPLFHAIARIGCFLAGCCYGIEYHGFCAINYTILRDGAELCTSRIPVQLMEAVLNICIFIYLCSLVKKDDWEDKNILVRYLVLYSCGRFLLEFIRGDTVRGVIYGVSFSQVIAILLMAGILIAHILKKKTKSKEISV